MHLVLHALRFDTLNSVCKVVGEPGKAVIRKTDATESDRVESLGQVDEDGCTVLSIIDGGYDIGNQIAQRRRYGGI
jgi:hypothetical protein